MNPTRRHIVALLTAMASPFPVLAQSPKKDSAPMGPQLRHSFLTRSAATLGLAPNQEFPRVFGIAVDWPIGEDWATIISLRDGSASLYTNGNFGIIGGGGDPTVSAAAQRLVKLADQFLSDALPTQSYPYPAKWHVRFYFLTYNDVRVIEADVPKITPGKGQYWPLFSESQKVLNELRIASEKLK